jgi:aminopeptidase
MTEDFAAKMARVITEYSTRVQPGDFVVIAGSVVAEPLLDALYRAVLRRGGHPHPLLAPANTREIFFQEANEEQLTFINPVGRMVYETADVRIDIEAPVNPNNLGAIDPARIGQHRAAHSEVIQTMIGRIGDGSLRWCGLSWPSQAAAMQMGIGYQAYREFLYRACNFHLADPVAHWQGVKEEQTRLVELLNGKSEVQVRGPGIDLSFSLAGRTWVHASGELNFPDGEIFTGPVEDSVNGTVAFNMRSIYEGQEVRGVRLTYQDGRIVEASAEKGEAFLLAQLDIDEGARRMGEFAIGTNYGIDQVTGFIGLDEKIGGTIHMAIGASLPDTGGLNQSAVHWDMVHDMRDGGEIIIDGEAVYREGKFLIS